ncbi:MAG: CDP-diacylglycerol--glycerol-3-phosphate 3-phosphatidyltransferase [Candidatus Sericytochromatia bacterium]
MPAPTSRDPAAATTSPTARLVNVANVLTTIRLALVPVFLLALFADGGYELRWRIAAFVVFAVAMVTDRFDGALARSYGLITEFGKLADPIADKALLGAALIGLSLLHELPWWVTVVILVREIGVTVLRFVVLHHGVIPASRGGKLKTLVQAVAIGLFILSLSGVWHLVAVVTMGVAVLLTVVTGVDYVAQAVKDSRRRSADQ